MNLTAFPRTVTMLTMFGVILTSHAHNPLSTILPGKQPREVVVPAQVQTFVEALVSKWAPACGLTEDEQRCVTLLSNRNSCKTPMPLARVRSALDKFCNNVKKACASLYGTPVQQELEKVCDYCTLCTDWIDKAMSDRGPSVRACPCPDMMEFFGSSEPLFACLLLVKRLMIQEELVVNGTACFNGLVTFCGNVSGLSGLSGIVGPPGPPGPTGATGATGASFACLCWDVLINSMTAPGTGEINFRPGAASSFVEINPITRDGVDARCFTICIAENDLLRFCNSCTGAGSMKVDSLVLNSPMVDASGIVTFLTEADLNAMFAAGECACIQNFGPARSSSGVATPCLCWNVTNMVPPGMGEINPRGPVRIDRFTRDDVDVSCFLAAINQGDLLRFCPSCTGATGGCIDTRVIDTPFFNLNDDLEFNTEVLLPTMVDCYCIQNFGPAQGSGGVATPCLCWDVISAGTAGPNQIILPDDASPIQINAITRDNVNVSCFLAAINQGDLLRFCPSCFGETGGCVDTRVTTVPVFSGAVISFNIDQIFSNFGDCACIQNFGPAQGSGGVATPCLCWFGDFTSSNSGDPLPQYVNWDQSNGRFIFNAEAKGNVDASCALYQLKGDDCVRLVNVDDPNGDTGCLYFKVGSSDPFDGTFSVYYLPNSLIPSPLGASGCWCLQNFGQACPGMNSFAQVLAFDHEIITSVPCCNSGLSGLSGCSGIVGIVNAGGPEQAVLRGLSLNQISSNDDFITLEQSQDPNDYTGVQLICFSFPGTYEITWNAHIAPDSLVEKGAFPYPTPESSQRVLLGLQLTNASGTLRPGGQPLGALNMIPLANIVASNVGSSAENLQPVLQAPLTVGSNFLIDIGDPSDQKLKFVGAKEGNDDPFTNVGLVAQDPRGTFFEQNQQGLTTCTGLSTRNIAAFVATIKRIGNLPEAI